MGDFFDWVKANPAEFGWALFGALTVLSTVYYRVEPAIKRYVEGTTATWDDDVFHYVQKVGAAVYWLVGLLAIFLPTFAGPRPQTGVGARTPLEPSDDDRADGDPTPRLGTPAQQEFREEKRR